MGNCRLCGEAKKLIKAHAIPEAFFRAARGDAVDRPLLVSAGEFPRRAPIGIYDPGILCAECEARFGSVDAYGTRVLLNEFDSLFRPLEKDGAVVGFESHGVDSRALLRFLVAILWRASVSRHSFYSRVQLGALEEPAVAFALEDRDDAGVFDAMLSRWKPTAREDLPEHFLMDPFRQKYNGVNAYRVYLGQATAEIKVDRRPFPGGMAQYGLRSAPPARMIIRDLARSSDLRAMRATAQLAKEGRRA